MWDAGQRLKKPSSYNDHAIPKLQTPDRTTARKTKPWCNLAYAHGFFSDLGKARCGLRGTTVLVSNQYFWQNTFSMNIPISRSSHWTWPWIRNNDLAPTVGRESYTDLNIQAEHILDNLDVESPLNKRCREHAPCN